MKLGLIEKGAGWHDAGMSIVDEEKGVRRGDIDALYCLPTEESFGVRSNRLDPLGGSSSSMNSAVIGGDAACVWLAVTGWLPAL